MPFTNGFMNTDELMEHFTDHAIEFGVSTPQAYLDLADAFLGGPVTKGTMECTRIVRWRGDRVRYNTVTEEFGVMTRQRVIITYFKPVPTIEHEFATNEEYFDNNCPPFR
jgi:pyocin large subunit-like protein